MLFLYSIISFFRESVNPFKFCYFFQSTFGKLCWATDGIRENVWNSHFSGSIITQNRKPLALQGFNCHWWANYIRYKALYCPYRLSLWIIWSLYIKPYKLNTFNNHNPNRYCNLYIFYYRAYTLTIDKQTAINQTGNRNPLESTT